MIKQLAFASLIFLFSTSLFGQATLHVFDSDNGKGIDVQCNGISAVASLPQGLWPIATQWQNRGPAGFRWASADSVEQINGYTLLHGQLSFPSGILKLRDAYRMEGRRVRCTRRWEWTGTDTLTEITLSIQYQSPELNKSVVMPGILYHGNPAGERSGRTPVYRGTVGELAVFEEHRFPMPYVSREFNQQDQLFMAAIHSLPSPVPFGNKPDQWWSLGVINDTENTNFVLASGPCAFNNERSVIKAFQGGGMMEEYDHAWMSMPPGTTVEKTFYIEVEPIGNPGSGFQRATETSLSIFEPWDLNGMSSFDEIMQKKIAFSLTRYRENKQSAGFWKYPDRDFFVLGWCGQAMAPGYAYQVLAERFDIPDYQNKVQKSLDFLSSSGFYESGFYTWYNRSENNWHMHGSPEWLSQGQAMLNMANAIRQGKIKGMKTKRWEEFMKKAANFHAARILQAEWEPESTNEGFFIAPLCLAYVMYENNDYLAAARKAADYYAQLYLEMNEVYWGGTLDASCEDKEGAFAALQGFIELYETTQEQKYLDWAKHAGDVCLTYTVVWDIPLPPGRLTDHNFKTRGWTAVSVQNMHIDVYGVFIAPYIYRLGSALNNKMYQKTAKLMFASCGQLIDPYGSQGEQPYQTNYIQTNWRDKPVHERRGNYLETWTVFWITAHFLNAGAMFMELGAM